MTGTIDTAKPIDVGFVGIGMSGIGCPGNARRRLQEKNIDEVYTNCAGLLIIFVG